MKKPDFSVAFDHFKKSIAERNYGSNLRWVFRENLCLEKHEQGSGLLIAFETNQQRVEVKDVRFIYEELRPQNDLIVFCVLAVAPDFTLCTLLGDDFDAGDEDSFIKEWDLHFFLEKQHEYIEEVCDATEWQHRKQHEWKRLSGLDFVFSLQHFQLRADGNKSNYQRAVDNAATTINLQKQKKR